MRYIVIPFSTASWTALAHARPVFQIGDTYVAGAYVEVASVTIDSAGAPSFTDDPLTAGVTTVKGMHVTELRQAVGALRTRYPSLGAILWTDASLVAGVTLVKAVHLAELRTALHEVYVRALKTPPPYTHATITGGATVITAVDIAALRAAILAMW